MTREFSFKAGDKVVLRKEYRVYHFNSFMYRGASVGYSSETLPDGRPIFTVAETVFKCVAGSSYPTDWLRLEEQYPDVYAPILAYKFELVEDAKMDLGLHKIKFDKEYTIKVKFAQVHLEDNIDWVSLQYISGNLPFSEGDSIRALSKDAWKGRFKFEMTDKPKVGDMIRGQNRVRAKVLYADEKGLLIEYKEPHGDNRTFIVWNTYNMYWDLCYEEND